MKSENLSSNMETSASEIRSEYKPSAFSGMWMKTLYRRDTLLAFVAFMAYFSVCILPLILNYWNFSSVSDYYVSVLSSSLSPVPFISCGYAVVLSVMLFNYLHNGASAAGLHSFPVTRGKLFRSTLMTGTVLLLLPVLLTAVVMFAFGLFIQPQHVAFDAETEVLSIGMEAAGRNSAILYPGRVLSALNCLRWFIDTAVGSLFVFAISNLAGIVAGKDIIHALLACLLNSIVVIVCMLCDMYERAFILGSDGSVFTEIMQYSNPFLWYAAKRGDMLDFKAIPMMLVFIAVTVLITLFTGFLYKRIRLEREQDATVFPVVSDMLVIFLTFCVMSLFGVVSAELSPGEHATYPLIPFLLGCIVGGVPSFIVFRMIADSSVRIIRVRTLITFIALLAVTAAVFAFTIFDVTGQTGRVPEPSSVEKVKVHTMAPFDTDVTLSDTESVKALTALHKTVLDHKNFVTGSDYDPDSIKVSMSYKMKNGSSLKRSYYIKAQTLKDVRKAASDFAAGDEYTEKVDNYLRKVIINAYSAGIDSSKGYTEIKKDDIRPLLTAYLKDYTTNGSDYYYRVKLLAPGSDVTYNFTSSGAAVINVSPDTANEQLAIDDSLFFSGCFGEKDKNVHKFLEKNGYAKELKKSEKEYDENTGDDIVEY